MIGAAPDTITWTAEMAVRLIDSYILAISKVKTEFDFDGRTFTTAYAKYLIEYLIERFFP